MRPTLILISVFFLVSACGKVDVNKGTVTVSLQDAPADNFEKVVINLKRIELVGEGGPSEVANFSDGEKVLDLLKLKDNPVVIGESSITPGTYTQVRLIVHDGGNYVVPVGGSQTEMVIASGGVTGAKLVNLNLEISGGENEKINLDWDLESVQGSQINFKQQSNQYLMTPVLKLVQ